MVQLKENDIQPITEAQSRITSCGIVAEKLDQQLKNRVYLQPWRRSWLEKKSKLSGQAAYMGLELVNVK